MKWIFMLWTMGMASFANNLISSCAPNVRFDWVRSRCFCGEKTLPVRHMVPLLSFFLLKHSCAFCGKKIPMRYFVVELLLITLGVVVVLTNNTNLHAAISYMIIYCYCIILFTDFLFYLIPNFAILLLAATTCLKCFWNLPLILERIPIVIFIVGVFMTVNYMYQRRRNVYAMGYGDIKLLGVIFLLYHPFTAFSGLWAAALTAVLFFPVMKLVSSRYKGEVRIPFGIFLAAVFIIIELFSLDSHLSNYVNGLFL